MKQPGMRNMTARNTENRLFFDDDFMFGAGYASAVDNPEGEFVPLAC